MMLFSPSALLAISLDLSVFLLLNMRIYGVDLPFNLNETPNPKLFSTISSSTLFSLLTKMKPNTASLQVSAKQDKKSKLKVAQSMSSSFILV